MVVGILGGSFDPPHEGHLHVASELMKLLQLDAVWWIVAINPQKLEGAHSLEDRVSMVENVIARYRSMKVMCADSPYSYKVVRNLQAKYPRARFVWIAGSDTLSTMHKWYRWEQFCKLLPIVLLERPGYVYNVLRMPFAVAMECERVPDLKFLLNKRRKGWNIVRGKICTASSTQIRNAMPKRRGTAVY
ncbi:MAG: nicotinate (nicotinamide) nucleotide adenylyltransferase [Anaplasma ovis]|uniref:Probable nicotinate-nucleotide adenylyltransferase n=1 Tax=Anaplasma ovis str. Haibei TaxID=1248439 RepID=A0A2Z2LI40_9RICK|nr:nicotinate (nicotinamide) nucleotide adenylyltransferase [Anaplasma ovis]ASI47569.1 nicotinate (nicotinamide) nucleotide adenylyltransferase [Anaplasma ovis str. Haibei]